MSGVIARLDHRVDEEFNRLRGHPVVDRAMYAASEAGNFSLLWHGISVLRAATGGERGQRAAIRLSSTLAIESVLVNGVLKSFSRRERPTPRDSHPHSLRTPVTSSFPSGHASAGACAAVLLSDDTGVTLPWVALAALVAASRVHVGQHHASDLVGGAMVGTLIGSVAKRVRPLP